MNQSININQIVKIAGDVLSALPKLAPWVLLLVLTLRLTRDALVSWRKPVDLPTIADLRLLRGRSGSAGLCGDEAVKVTRPCAVTRDLALTARWSVATFWPTGIPDHVRRAELKRRLFRINHPRADRRQRGPRSVEMGAWVEKWPVMTSVALSRGYRVRVEQVREK